MGRGMLTDEIKKKSVELLGYEITTQELRLMPYLIFCVTNDQNIEISKVNNEERKILMKWQEKGFVESPAAALAINKSFYDAANELIFIGYVQATERNK